MTDQEDNQNINRLKAIRRGNRSVVTKLSNEALEYLNTEDELPETKLSRPETIDNQLQTKLNVLEELNQQLLRGGLSKNRLLISGSKNSFPSYFYHELHFSQ